MMESGFTSRFSSRMGSRFSSGGGGGSNIVPLVLNPVAWLAADKIPLGAVATYTDPLGITYEQATEANQPVNTADEIGGKPALVFDGSKELGSTFVFPSGGYTLFSVVKLTAALSTMTGFPRIIRANNDSQSHFWRGAAGNGNFEVKSQSNDSNDPRPNYNWETNFPTDTAAILTNTVGLSSLEMCANGAELATANRSATASSLIVGTTTEIGLGVIGAIAEILAYDRILSTTEITAVEQYLSSKYGITLA